MDSVMRILSVVILIMRLSLNVIYPIVDGVKANNISMVVQQIPLLIVPFGECGQIEEICYVEEEEVIGKRILARPGDQAHG